jgi:acyl carrier protein
MTDELTNKVLSIVASTKRIALEQVRPESTFEQLGIDSLDAVNILFALEGEFNINIPDEEARSIRTVQEMIEGVRKLVTSGAANASAS